MKVRMETDNPLISIIVRTKDRPKLLKIALESIAAQNYRPIEVILVNDGGCDLTIEGIKEILRDVSLNYIRFETSRGRAAAGNAGILSAHGTYIGFLDDDDEFIPDHLSTLVSFLTDSNYRVAYAESEFIVRELDPGSGRAVIRDRKLFASYDFSYVDLLVGNYIPLISLLFSGEVLKNAGGFDESFELYEDWDLLLRIGNEYPFHHIKKVTTIYNQWSKRSQIAQSAELAVTKNAFAMTIRKHLEKITPEVILNLKDKQETLTSELKDLILRFSELESELSRMDAEVSRKIAQLSEKDAILLLKDTELSQKDTELSQKESEISALSDGYAALERQIAEIQSTLGWRILIRLRHIRDGFLPLGSKRRKIYQKVIRSIKKSDSAETPVSTSEDVKTVGNLETNHLIEESDPLLSIHSLSAGDADTKQSFEEAVTDDKTAGAVREITAAELDSESYNVWIKEHEPDEKGLNKQRAESRLFLYRPLISIIVPVYNTDRTMLMKMIESVLAQTYENWQLCIADGNSSESHVREILRSCAESDGRIRVKYLEENKHISGNSNEALSLADGEFVGFLDHDDELSPSALYEVVRLLNEDPAVDFIYSDEDKLDLTGGRSLPLFKPDWSPDLLLSVNYICHFSVLRAALVNELGGFRKGYDGAQDFDLFLRASRITSRIVHIPKVLYHWREHMNSTSGDVSRKNYADAAGKAALADFLKSKGIEGLVLSGRVKTNYQISYGVKGSPLVSIIIPFRDRVDLLKKCIESILEKSTYNAYEVILVSNRSVEEATFLYIDSIRRDARIRALTFDGEFNFSRINNYAVRKARGDYLVFLNNDTEVITGDWLTILLEQAQREEIGVVGSKLLFPDHTVQHAGIIMGMTGFAGHVFHGLPDHLYTYFGSADFIRNVLAVTGACMIVKKEIFERAGGFDESFTVCGGDVDFCLKLYETGYRNIYTPYAVLYHHESASRGPHIPVSDFRLSIERYRKFLDGRDPYYNPNLTLIKTDCSLKMIDEENILKEIRENAMEQNGVIAAAGEDKQHSMSEAVNLVEALDFSITDLDMSRALMCKFEEKRPAITSMNWFIPHFHHAFYGGIHTILRFGNFFSRKGVKNRFVLYDTPSLHEGEIDDKITSAFPDMKNSEIFINRSHDVNRIPYADVSIATLWTSAYSLLKFKHTLGKFYFIQDYEPLFYPASTCYAMAEATYRFGFHGIVNTPGLYDFIKETYDMKAQYFVPAVDRDIFFPAKKSPGWQGERPKLFFYGRPSHDRNAFDLAIATAKKINATLGSRIEIVSAGSEWNPKDYGLDGTVTNLGLLGYKETGDLFRESGFGLILMFTKHPSYLPMELMASGSIVITNHNDANTWLLKDGTNCILVEPSPTYIAEKLLNLIDDPELQETIRDNALQTAASFNWEREMEKIYKFITGS
jgi:glycosyltransferase involved in cell wall biosynthesis